jgi:hypothetical protein
MVAMVMPPRAAAGIADRSAVGLVTISVVWIGILL